MCRKPNEISPAILHVLHYYLKDQHHETGYDFNIFSLFENNVKNLALQNVNIMFQKFIWACAL